MRTATRRRAPFSQVMEKIPGLDDELPAVTSEETESARNGLYHNLLIYLSGVGRAWCLTYGWLRSKGHNQHGLLAGEQQS